jgi:hypothetical protein
MGGGVPEWGLVFEYPKPPNGHFAARGGAVVVEQVGQGFQEHVESSPLNPVSLARNGEMKTWAR